MTDRFHLASGDLEAVVEPAFGARISAFRCRGGDLFVPVPDGPRDLSVGAAAGCFPLVPWSNRVRDARMAHAGRTLDLTATDSSGAHAIHGHGRRRAWTVTADGGASSVRMSYAHQAGEEGWPFAYRAEQTVSLGEGALSVTLSVENQAAEDMPVGIGLHPYLPKTPEIGLWFSALTSWAPVEGSLPSGPQPVPTAHDFAEPRALVLGLDQGYGGWDGSLHAIWPERGLGLSIHGGAALGHLIVFTPPERDFVCLEPVSHCVDAANLASRGVPATGHRLLAPGERLVVTVRFQVEVF